MLCEPFMELMVLGHNCIILVDETAIDRGRQSGKCALMHMSVCTCVTSALTISVDLHMLRGRCYAERGAAAGGRRQQQ